MNKDIEELSEYAGLEETEIGEMLSALIAMHRYIEYVSEDFGKAIENEVQKQTAWFRKHVEIVEREVTEKYTVQELRFDS